MAKYRFGGFSLDTKTYQLSHGQRAIPLPPRHLEFLASMAARPRQLVTRDDLLRELWPDVIVNDNTLSQLVSEVREALDESTKSPRCIQTVARRGYRFIAAVEEIHEPQAPAASPPSAIGQFVQTSSLEVLRSIFDGRLKLESLGAAEIEAGIALFARAVQLDPAFAGGYVGLANAKFWKYEQTRSRFEPDTALLAAAIQDARQAVALASALAEAHATLSYLLTASGRSDDARTAAQRAVALQPEFWAHHFRLGHATWGGERLRALTRCLELYPPFAFAHFEMAMVHVARHSPDVARTMLREGAAIQERHGSAGAGAREDAAEGANGAEDAASARRFPANGLHWMLGAIALSQGDAATAVAECDRELAGAGRSLYAREFSVSALNTRGFAFLDSAADCAAEAFQQSLALNDEQVRPHVGLAQIAQRRGRTDEWNQARALAQRGVDQLRRGGRSVETLTMEAAIHALEDRQSRAIATLMRVIEEPSPQAGWSIPIDPLFASLRMLPEYERVSRALTARAE